MARKVFSSGLSAQARSSAVVQPSTAAPGVSQIVAGTNITISPQPGTGIVKINAAGGGSGNVTGPASSVTSDVALFADGTGKVLKDGGAMPTSLPPSGAAGGDLSGNYPNPTLKNTGPGATGPIGDSTHVAAVTIDAQGRVTALSSVAISAGGIPSGGAKYTRLAKNSTTNYDTGWYKDAYIYASDYGVVADGSTADDTAFGNALDAAISANACLLLPPGAIKLTAAVTKTVVGAVCIRGLGRKVSTFKFTNATAGLSFNCSTYPATGNYVQLEGIGIIAANTGCGLALKIDYGTGSELNSVEDRVLSSLYDLEIGGNGWVNGIYLRNAWHLSANHIYLCGNSSTWDSGSGAGSGKAIELISCVNELWSDVSIEYFNKGWSFETIAGSHSCQGILVSQVFWLACNNCVNFTPVDGGDHTDAIIFDTFLIDNGNFYGANIQSVYLEQANNFQFVNGEVLQNSNHPAFYFLNCSACKVSNVSVYQSGGTVTALNLDGTTQYCTVTGCFFDATAAILCGASTNYNIVQKNAISGTVTDGSTTNLVGDEVGFTGTQALTGGAATETHFLDISKCHLGRTPDGAAVAVTNDQGVTAQYNWDDAGNTKTSIAIRYFKFAGGNLSAVTYRYSVRCGP